MVERNSQQAGCKGFAVTFTSTAPRRFSLHPGVTQERPIAADLAATDRPRAAGKGDTHGL
jgi:hypothetical protein